MYMLTSAWGLCLLVGGDAFCVTLCQQPPNCNGHSLCVSFFCGATACHVTISVSLSVCCCKLMSEMKAIVQCCLCFMWLLQMRSFKLHPPLCNIDMGHISLLRHIISCVISIWFIYRFMFPILSFSLLLSSLQCNNDMGHVSFICQKSCITGTTLFRLFHVSMSVLWWR